MTPPTLSQEDAMPLHASLWSPRLLLSALLLVLPATPALALEPAEVEARINQVCGAPHGLAPQSGTEPWKWLELMREEPGPYVASLDARLDSARIAQAAGDPVARRRLACVAGLLGALDDEQAWKVLEARTLKVHDERLYRLKVVNDLRAKLGPKPSTKERDLLRLRMDELEAFLAVERTAVGTFSSAKDARLALQLVTWLQKQEPDLWGEYVDSLERTSKGDPAVDGPLLTLMKAKGTDYALRRRLERYFYGK